MARTVLTFLLLLGFLQIFLTPAFAADGAYIVRDVKVDILSESAVKAREKAFGEAQKAAYLKLAARYLSADELKAMTLPDAKTIAGLVQDFEVQSEQLSTKRYVGLYTFRFKAGAANRHFNRSPSYVEADAELPKNRADLVILPFFQQGTASPILWDARRNPWLQAWQKTDLSGNPALLLPLGDASDMMDVRDGQALTYNPAGLKRLRSRYEAREAAVLLAKFTEGQKTPLVVEIYRTDRKPPELIKSLPIEIGSSRTLGDLIAKAIIQCKEVLAGTWKLETIVSDTEEAEAGAEEQQTAVQPQSYKPLSGQVRVQTRFASISEWLELRRSLNAVPSLTAVKIVALKSNEAVVDLAYADWASLSNALGARGLTISGQGDGTYRLMRGAPVNKPFYR